MKAKIANRKTTCAKKSIASIVPVAVNAPKLDMPSVVVAYVVGCAEVTVKKIRNGERSNNTDLGQRVEVADLLLTDGFNTLMETVKKSVKQ